MNSDFWNDRSVFVTGHTGFKGGWLAFWLSEMGAKVYGYSLEAATKPNFFDILNLETSIKNSSIGDVRDLAGLIKSMEEAKPSVIFHMAAQPLVLHSYNSPLETFTTNIIGSINVFEAARKIETVEAIINVTTDKCYENQESNRPYNEKDRLGGYDPYSSSKACSEIVTSAYRNSFLSKIKVKLASVRAGNVIGGGDWAADRLIPDIFRSLETNKTLYIRSPKAVRPWQHVLEPLSGYLMLAEKLIVSGDSFAEAWNFGPEQSDTKTVLWILDKMSKQFENFNWAMETSGKQHETNLLKLDITKAKLKLGWKPRWTLETSIDNTIQWYQAYIKKKNMIEFTKNQIRNYQLS